ncbi:MAG: hypothetical protein QME60_09075 [Verrucomicrobiota bacterium]|nr:hypothetical protein [Verrucomicrobiota bacterium]
MPTKAGEPADPVSASDSPAPIPPDLNPQVRSVVEAMRAGKHPERLTSSLKPKPFNKAEYDANPEAYLDVCEPGRIWDVAEPGPGVRQIAAKTEAVVDMKPGESATLLAIAVAHAPVTFTSFDWGEFQNRLTSITVQADSSGIASAIFTATPGTVGQVDILAASPLTSSQVKFHIHIAP